MQNIAGKHYDLGPRTSVVVGAEIDFNRSKRRTNLVHELRADAGQMIEDQLIKVGKADHLGIRS
jgi:hypothetical protein